MSDAGDFSQLRSCGRLLRWPLGYMTPLLSQFVWRIWYMERRLNKRRFGMQRYYAGRPVFVTVEKVTRMWRGIHSCGWLDERCRLLIRDIREYDRPAPSVQLSVGTRSRLSTVKSGVGTFSGCSFRPVTS